MTQILEDIRGTLVFVWVPVITFILSIATILSSIFDPKGIIPHLIARAWAKLVLWECGVKVTVEGLENINPKHSYIYAANHQSLFDIPAVLGYLPVQFRWLAKKELFQIPIFGLAMRRVGYIPIDRSHPKKAVKSLEEAANKIHSGTSVLIFPEGTRSVDGRLLPFKSGGITIALKSKCPVIPMVIYGSKDILPRGRLRPRSGHIKIIIGKAIETAHYNPSQKNLLATQLREAIESLLAKAEKTPGN